MRRRRTSSPTCFGRSLHLHRARIPSNRARHALVNSDDLYPAIASSLILTSTPTPTCACRYISRLRAPTEPSPDHAGCLSCWNDQNTHRAPGFFQQDALRDFSPGPVPESYQLLAFHTLHSLQKLGHNSRHIFIHPVQRPADPFALTRSFYHSRKCRAIRQCHEQGRR